MGNINILIVEDERRLAEILKKQLEESGFNAEIASDGYTGRQLVEKNKYNLIKINVRPVWLRTKFLPTNRGESGSGSCHRVYSTQVFSTPRKTLPDHSISRLSLRNMYRNR